MEGWGLLGRAFGFHHNLEGFIPLKGLRLIKEFQSKGLGDTSLGPHPCVPGGLSFKRGALVKGNLGGLGKGQKKFGGLLGEGFLWALKREFGLWFFTHKRATKTRGF